MTTPLRAQFVARPHLDWRTTRTEHFEVHYPADYREWSRAVAARLESARLAVGDVVGYVPTARVQVLVDDPVNAPNGFALPFLDRPTMVFFPVPPTPRQSIGNARDWGELLAVHEFAHLAHLARPARRRWDYGQLLPYPISPIARRSPRWVTEGFATYVEGRVTGSGRPHNAQRAAVLRQWALEGRLPTYAQMSGSSAYNGGAFAYLVGSAYLEWLAAREGDSTLTHLWRRMTARTSRTFPEAFVGVYGRRPEELHGRFNVEVTRSALAVERAIDSLGGVRDGELVQRLAWETGDPALSHDGRHVALVLRSPTRPGRVVVWTTRPDSITRRAAAARDSARARAIRRDTLDVPDRRFYPPAKRAVAVLEPRDGRAFDTPRFMPDGRHLLVTHAEPVGSGAYRPDLFMWNHATGALRRITHGAAVRQADPAPDGRTAVAVQCTRGWCDLVRVDLADGAVTVLREGSPAISYHRPRSAPDGGRIAVAEQRDGRWRILVLDARDPSRGDVLPSAEASANQFDAAWADSGRTLVLVSDAGGIANLERVTVADGRAIPVTRVTGGAFAPAVDPVTGDVWFLALHAGGLDVRRLPAPQEGLVLPAPDRSLFPALPAPPDAPPPDLAPTPLVPDRPYGNGPRDTRWLPGVVADASGFTGQLLLVDGDPVGRLELAVVGAFGTSGGWRGARGWATVRRWRPSFTTEAFAARQGVGMGPSGRDAAVTLVGGGLRTVGRLERSAWRAGAAVGAASMRVHGDAAGGAGATRTTGWIDADAAASRRLFATGFGVGARLRADAGRHRIASVAHATGTIAATVDLPLVPAIGATVTHARTFRSSAAIPFERVSVGGAAPALLDPSLLPPRIAMPALPVGTLAGDRATVARAEIGFDVLTPYVWTARVNGDVYAGWQRVVGVDARFSTAAIPVVTLPQVDLTAGAGYSLDAPWRRRLTVYGGVTYRP